MQLPPRVGLGHELEEGERVSADAQLLEAPWLSHRDAGRRAAMLVDGHEEPLGADFLCGPRCHQAGMRDRLATIDGFAFLGPGDTVLAVLIRANRVAPVYPNGTRRVVLTAADGLSHPTSVAVRGTNIHVPSAAYFTQKDPNLLLARLTRST